MDGPELRDRLSRIEQRQHLVFALLVIPYLLGIAEVIGYAVAGVLYTAFAVVVFGLVVFHRRRSRSAAGQ